MTQLVSGVEFGFSSFFKGFLKAVSSNIECKGGNRYSGGTTITIFSRRNWVLDKDYGYGSFLKENF